MRSASGEIRPGAENSRLCRGPGGLPGKERHEENIPALGPGSQGAPWFPRADGDQERPQDHQSPPRPGAEAPVRLTEKPAGLTGKPGSTEEFAGQAEAPVRSIEESATPPIATLKQRRDFLACARANRWTVPGLLLQARRRSEAERAGEGIRVGFTCSRKIGNAVARNRAKRRLRAAAAEVLPAHGRPGWDYVLVGRPQATIERERSEERRVGKECRCQRAIYEGKITEQQGRG